MKGKEYLKSILKGLDDITMDDFKAIIKSNNKESDCGMKHLKAIYLGDLAFSQSYNSYVFRYNKKHGKLEMESKRDIKYSLSDTLEDDHWIYFQTELMKDINPDDEDDTLYYGNVKQLTPQEAWELSLLIDKNSRRQF